MSRKRRQNRKMEERWKRRRRKRGKRRRRGRKRVEGQDEKEQKKLAFKQQKPSNGGESKFGGVKRVSSV